MVVLIAVLLTLIPAIAILYPFLRGDGGADLAAALFTICSRFFTICSLFVSRHQSTKTEIRKYVKKESAVTQRRLSYLLITMH